MCNHAVTLRPRRRPPWFPSRSSERPSSPRPSSACGPCSPRPSTSGRWFGDAGAEIDLRPGGAMVVRWSEHGTVHARGSRPSSRTSASPTAGRPTAIPADRSRVDGELDARGVHARVRRAPTPGCGWWRAASATSTAPRARQAENAEGNREGWQIELGDLGRLRAARSPSDAPPMSAPRRRGLRGAGGPDPLARAQPARRAGRGDRHDAGRRAAGEPAWQSSSASRSSTGRVSSRARRQGREVRYTVRPERLDAAAPLDGGHRLAVGRAPGGDQAAGRGGAGRRLTRAGGPRPRAGAPGGGAPRRARRAPSGLLPAHGEGDVPLGGHRPLAVRPADRGPVREPRRRPTATRLPP